MVAFHGKQKVISVSFASCCRSIVVLSFSLLFYTITFFYSLISFLFIDAIYLKVNILLQCLITLLVLMQITTNVSQKRNFAINLSSIQITVDECGWEKYCAPFSVILFKIIQGAEFAWWRRFSRVR